MRIQDFQELDYNTLHLFKERSIAGFVSGVKFRIVDPSLYLLMLLPETPCHNRS